MRFRPCIDLREGRVVQIVGGTLSDDQDSATINHVSDFKPQQIARLYAEEKLPGGHVIALGPGNERAANEALAAWPGGLQYGGGVNDSNARTWLAAGASHVIVTSWLFSEGRLDRRRLERLADLVGPEQLVLDLSCRWRNDGYYVVTDRWQTFTQTQVTAETLHDLGQYCSEFLVHGVDVEGLSQGLDARLVEVLADATTPVTYAGGIRNWDDIAVIEANGHGRIDFTIGTALDLFGGTLPWKEVARRYR